MVAGLSDLRLPPTPRGERAYARPMRSRLAAVGLVLAAAAGCSSSSHGASGTSSGGTDTLPTASVPAPALVGQVHKLTSALGCPDAAVIAGTGFANGAETAECDSPYRGVFVFPDAAARDAWLSEARGAGGFYVTGPTWAIQLQTRDDLADVAKRTGGSTT